MYIKPLKASLLAPLLGTFIATLIWFFYLIIYFRDYGKEKNFFLNLIFETIKITPLMFVCFLIIGYLLTYTIGLLIYKIKNEKLMSQLSFLFTSSFTGFVIGFILGYINYKFNSDVMKSIIIVISVSSFAMFSSSLFLVLTEPLSKKKGFW